MAQNIHCLEAETIRPPTSGKDAFALDILVGLSGRQKTIPSIYHYDEEGGRLFKRITELPEYYLTRCEADTLTRNKESIAGIMRGDRLNLIEFGPGDGSKTMILIEHLILNRINFQYVPIDICRPILDELALNYSRKYPDLNVDGLEADYFDGLKWLNSHSHNRNLVLFLGSNIGNFTSDEARRFMHHLWICLNDGDIVLIGFDLKKDVKLLLDAYGDSEGVTAEFNLNLLRRINRELGGEFDLSRFGFYRNYDVKSGAMESYLISLEEQVVYIKEIGRSFHFGQLEAIHTEYSYKYSEDDIESLAADTGYVIREHLYDTNRYFVDSIWEVKKGL